MNWSVVAPALISALISGIMVGIGSIVAVKIAFARMEVRQGMMESMFERRLANIELAVGISSGDRGAFVRRGECLVLEQAVRDRLKEVVERLEHVDARLLSIERGQTEG